MPSRQFCTLVLSLILVFCLCPFSQGQSTYGAIAGLVTDPTGAAVPGAQVTLTNVGTSEKRTQATGADGLYSFVNLIPGEYRIDVEKQGFKHFERKNLVVQVNQTSKIDAALAVGQVSETVEVTSETPLIQSETSSLGQVVEQRKANELPLNGRNIYNLTAVAPSVVPQGNTTGTVVGKNPFDFANYQIGGSFANQSAEYLDGQPLNIGYINLPLLVPTQDSVSEFKVQYNNLGPEWGKFSGGVINLSTKSGTNTWHGSAYEYLRNKVFNANEYFNKRQQISTGASNEPPPFTQNQFGASIGGPILKDKTFVFFSYEGFRLRSGTVFSTNVPTAAERTGDFSASGVTIFDPLSVNPASCTNPNVACVRTAFAGNVIPSNRINPTSAFLLKYLPLPNSSGAFNFVKAASTGGDIDEYVARGDQNISARQRIFGRYSQWKLLSLAQDPFGTGFCKDRCQENTKSYSAAIGYNFAVTPTTIVDVNLSASRFNYIRNPLNANFDFTQEGWPSNYTPLVPPLERTPLTPCFAISDPLVTCSQGQSAIADHNTQWNLSPQVTMIRGKHQFNWGGQLEMGYDNYLQTNTGGGLISFNGSWTQDFARNFKGATGGVDFADFLLGFGLGQGAQFGNQTTGSLVISGPVSGKQTYRALYFGDNWKIRTNLTLNLGLRYELQGPWSERFDKMTYFDPKATNTSVTGCGGTAGSTCVGDLFLVKTGVNGGRNNLPLSKTQFMPRLGFAYSLNPKTVIRGGYGIFFIPNYVSFGTNPYVDPVSSATSNFFASNDKGLTPSATLNQNTCTLAGAGGAANFSCSGQGPFNTNSANTLVAVPGRNPQPNVSQYILNQSNFSATGYTVQKYGYLQQYNLDIQRELPDGFFVDVAYAGSHGVHLEQFNTNINQIPDSFIVQAAQQAAAGQTPTIAQPVTSYPFACPLCNPMNSLPGGLAPTTLIQGQLDRPFPQYAGLNLNGYGCCGSSYNALQVSATKRFQGGGTLLVAYTNAKLMSDTDTLTSWLEGGTSGGTGAIQDWNNLGAERSLSSQDVSQRLVISYVLDLPFGRGRKYANDYTGFKNGIISGWGVDGVTTFQKGFPVKISSGSGNSLTALGLGTGTLRPNVVPGCNKSTSGSATDRLSGWFNTGCFTAAPAWGFGNESRVDATLRQEGANNWDFAVFKKTQFGPDDRLGIEFRTEFFNIFNRPQFGPPNGTCVVSNLGNCQFDPASGTGSKTFGVVSNTINNQRLIQFGLKFSF
jgi:Carboxypeptidase regulatory-like domain